MLGAVHTALLLRVLSDERSPEMSPFRRVRRSRTSEYMRDQRRASMRMLMRRGVHRATGRKPTQTSARATSLAFRNCLR